MQLTLEGISKKVGPQTWLYDMTLAPRSGAVTVLLGATQSGKTSLMRIMAGLDAPSSGRVQVDGKSVVGVPVRERNVAMVYQQFINYPSMTVFDNIAYGRRVHGMTDKAEIQQAVESSLQATLLWDDLKDKLNAPAPDLPPEQQQRLCISRLLAIEPEVLLMDEPCSALDPVATLKIEELMRGLKSDFTIVIVTHNMQQAARVSEETGFMLLGELVEFGRTPDIFTSPRDKRTEDYITGRFG